MNAGGIGWWQTEQALRAQAEDEVANEEPSNEESSLDAFVKWVRERIIRRPGR